MRTIQAAVFSFNMPNVDPTKGKILPFPQNQARMAEYQRRKAAGEIIFDGKNWREVKTTTPTPTPPAPAPTAPKSISNMSYGEKQAAWDASPLRKTGPYFPLTSDAKLQAYLQSQTAPPPTPPSPPPAPSPEPTPTPAPGPYTGPSIIDYLKSIGQPSDFAHRAVLAREHGITNYTGTADQNTQLLDILRGGGAPAAIPTPTPTPIPEPEPEPVIPEKEKTPEQIELEEAMAKYPNLPPAMAVSKYRADKAKEGVEPTKPPEEDEEEEPEEEKEPTLEPTAVPTPQEQALMTTYGATLEQIRDPEWVRGKISEIMDKVATLTDQKEIELEIKNIVQLLAAAGFSPTETANIVKMLSAPVGQTEEELRKELYEKYGITDLEEKFKSRPTQTFEEIYETIYDKLNLSDLKAQIDDAIKQITKANEEFELAVGRTNENPWYSEDQRTGELRRITEMHEIRAARLNNQRTILENLYERGKEDAEQVATRAINTFDKERDWAKEELQYYLKRAEADIEAKLAMQKEAAEKESWRYFGDWLAAYKPEEEAPKLTDAERIDQLNEFIDSKRNWAAFGKISAEDYQLAAQKWIALGGTPSDFKFAFPPDDLVIGFTSESPSSGTDDFWDNL